jgi:lysophospholipase L1-like esterase
VKLRIAAVLLLGVFLLDFGARLFLRLSNRHPGLLWPPRSVIEHRTDEFAYVARINNLGFRDRDAAIRPRLRRVLVIGDSFAYGWGVNAGESWPDLLERDLEIEVLNLGSPGSSPAQYAGVAERAVPLLRPDLVIVAVLQADDLLQCSMEQPPPPQRLRETARRVLPGLLDLFTLAAVRPLKVSAADFENIWKKQTAEFIPQMSAAERARFDALPAGAREAYRAGRLNPGLLFYSLRHSSFLKDEPEPSAVAKLAAHLARIRRLAKTMALSVPHRAYASPRDLDTVRALGFDAPPELLNSLAPDRAIHRASALAGVEFVTVTEPFHRQAAARPLYFRWDDHFNAEGHGIFARLVSQAPGLRRALPARRAASGERTARYHASFGTIPSDFILR